jgi:hypothetical protein
LEKRNRLRSYYNVYYQRMSAIARTPELKLALEALKSSHEGLMDQPRVRPTPTPPGATPTPTPSGTPVTKKLEKHKKKEKRRKKF